MSNVPFDQCTGKRIALGVCLLGEEAEMMALRSDNNREFDRLLLLACPSVAE